MRVCVPRPMSRNGFEGMHSFLRLKREGDFFAVEIVEIN